MDEASLKTALSDLPLGDVRYFPMTGSTNDDAAAWLSSGAPHLALVVAGEQTAGRGRAGRTWHSPPDSSLAFSLILKPKDIRSTSLAHLAGLGALALCRALENDFSLRPVIKWPNDVLVNESKAAGVLAEASWFGDTLEAVILGIGVNLTPAAASEAARREGKLRFAAGSISPAEISDIQALDLLHRILAEIITCLDILGSAEFVREWENRLAFRNEMVQIMNTSPGMEEQTDQGRILGLREDGALILETASRGIITVHSGEVRLLPFSSQQTAFRSEAR